MKFQQTGARVAPAPVVVKHHTARRPWRSLLRAIVALALPCAVAFSTLAAAAPDDPPPAAFGEDLKAELISIGIPARDTNWILAPLVEIGAVEPVPEQRLRPMSLAEINNQRWKLASLYWQLKEEYQLQAPPVRRYDFGDQPAEPPVVASWSNLGLSSSVPRDLYATPKLLDLPGAQPEQLRWQSPLRIARTGVAAYDAALKRAVANLRAQNPRLPIDDRTFPNPVERANVFIDWRGIQCPVAGPCRRVDTGALRDEASRILGTKVTEDEWLWPLIFFDQVRPEGWTPSAPLYQLPARVSSLVTRAWLRTNDQGQINAAYCDWVEGPGTSGFAANPDPAKPPVRTTPERMTRAARACLGAVLGAPSQIDAHYGSRLGDYHRRAADLDSAIDFQKDQLAKIYR